MLLQLLINQPHVLGVIVKNTPMWVWGMLAGLVWLGLSQVRDRTASLVRITLMPVIMTSLSVWGTISAFSSSPMFGYVMLVWMFAAAVTLALIAPMSAPKGARYDASSRSFALPGSWVPMLLILGIFLTKYFVGVELSMQPSLAHDGQYTLVVGAIYGAFSGIFTGRALRLWRLAYRAESNRTQPVFNV